MPKQLSKTILLSQGRNYQITPKWHIIYLQTIASNVLGSVKLSFSCCVRSSFRYVIYKLTQDWALNDINLWKKRNHTHTCTHKHTNTDIYIYEQETNVSKCCVVKINKKHNVCLTNVHILLILSHVCEWWDSQRLQFIY